MYGMCVYGLLMNICTYVCTYVWSVYTVRMYACGCMRMHAGDTENIPDTFLVAIRNWLYHVTFVYVLDFGI